MNMLLPIHIAAGGLAIIFGFGALFVRKGGTIHRRSGMLFVYAMLVMGITATLLELLHRSSVTNLVAALLSMYFVGTALTTVRPPSRWTRVINIAALILAAGLALVSFIGGVQGVSKPGLSPGGVPFRTIGVMSFVLATALALAAAGDVRVMRSGPRAAARAWRAICGGCASHSSSPPARSSPSASAWRKSSPRHSPPARCARFPSSCCSG